MPVDPITAALDVGGKIIDKLWPDKNEAEKMKVKLVELQQTGQLEELKLSMSAILAEAQSVDKWTSRARPTFLYIIYLMIVMAIPMGFITLYDPVLPMAVADGMGRWLRAIPEDLWILFGVGYTGYAVSRSFDKWKTGGK